MVATTYFWDPIEDNVIQSKSLAGEIANFNTDPNVFGEVNSVTENGNVQYLHSDAMGSVLATTDNNQVEVGQWSYSGYGVATEGNGSRPGALGFIGKRQYAVTANEYLIVRRRILSTKNARWQSKDIVADDDLLNTYRYCGSNPIAAIDASGLKQTTPCPFPPRTTKLVSMVPNNPTSPGDSDTTIGIQIKTQSLIYGPCGAFNWKIQWKLKTPAATRGYILQYVKVTIKVVDCNGKDITGNYKRPHWNLTNGWKVWEAWEVNAGADVTIYAENKNGKKGNPNDDAFGGPDRGVCTKGSMSISGEYGWVPGPVSSKLQVTNQPPAGTLPSTQTDPAIAWVGKSREHDITVKWDCCK